MALTSTMALYRVPVTPLDLGDKGPVRIPVLADCPQDLAGPGVCEVRTLAERTFLVMN